ncbi:hypothetical protein CC80DRAFT_588928 [Byssothecium circinans]|uniref:Uncharacterized protein n=1 Tax=Byssothecium circinans TaxID=147558 RepID=A0A6A5UDI3_9PLEO|nr:hypothetical protein CC80DRAFT_588928 [Byssothecium circinans]
MCRGSFVLALCATAASVMAAGMDPTTFRHCYNEKIKPFDISTPASDLICSRANGSAILGPQSQPYVTVKGCRSLCGGGYQLWPKSETGLRFLWFITPIFLLAARYAYAPIGVSNKIWTYIHLVGDPIDSMWNTLISQEMARRNYHLAQEIAPGAAKEVAAIWTAYDTWWQDAALYTKRNLEERNPNPVDQNNTAPKDTKIPDLLRYEEIYHIKKCAIRLAKNRSTNLALSWIAIMIFLASMVGAYVRTATTQKTNQTSHTLAIVMLFSFLVFAVYISGHVGNFSRVGDAIEDLEKLSKQCSGLFPELDGVAVPKEGGAAFKDRFGKVSICAGINHSWRPNKTLAKLNESDRSIWILFALSFLIVTIAWLFAFLLSYKTPRVGFGCRSLTWTCIYLAWVFSALIDVACYKLCPPTTPRGFQRWWRYGSIPKDIFFTASVMVLVVVVQFGYYNSCWCMASNLLKRTDPQAICIDLGLVTKDQLYQNWFMWLTFPLCGLIGILILIFLAGYEGEGGRMLFYRTESDLVSEEKALKTIRIRRNMPLGDDERDALAEGGDQRELQPLVARGDGGLQEQY